MSLRVDRLAEQQRLALGRRQQAGQHLHRRGLAAAVRAEEAEDLAALDREADVVDGGEVAEAAGEVVRLDRRLAVDDARAAGCRSARWPARFASGSSAMKASSSVRAPVCALSSAGVPVARTRPASMATSQSNRSASSM